MGKSLVDQKFGRLTVMAEAGRDNHGHRLYECRCDCGNPDISIVRGSKLAAKDTRQRATSCGCVKAENFVRFHDTRAEKISPDVKAEIFRLRCYGEKAQKIAARKRLSKATVDAVVRVTGKAVMQTKWMPVIKSAVKTGRNYYEIAARTGLLPSTVAYIAKRIRQQVKESSNESREHAA